MGSAGLGLGVVTVPAGVNVRVLPPAVAPLEGEPGIGWGRD